MLDLSSRCRICTITFRITGRVDNTMAENDVDKDTEDAVNLLLKKSAKDLIKTTDDVKRIIDQSLKKNPKDQRRYFVAYLADGTKRMESACRWVDVPLYDIIKLDLRMGTNTFRIEARYCPGFVEFIQFKTASRGLRSVPGQPDKTVSRCIGWTNGAQEFIIRIDEETCKRIGGVEVDYLRQGHLHPSSNLREIPNTIEIPTTQIAVSSHDAT